MCIFCSYSLKKTLPIDLFIHVINIRNLVSVIFTVNVFLNSFMLQPFAVINRTVTFIQTKERRLYRRPSWLRRGIHWQRIKNCNICRPYLNLFSFFSSGACDKFSQQFFIEQCITATRWRDWFYRVHLLDHQGTTRSSSNSSLYLTRVTYQPWRVI